VGNFPFRPYIASAVMIVGMFYFNSCAKKYFPYFTNHNHYLDDPFFESRRIEPSKNYVHSIDDLIAKK